MQGYANNPTLPYQGKMFATRLKDPERGSFICFKLGGESSVFRCIAKANDIVEIKDAVVYINGKKQNEPFVWNEYLISTAQLNSILGYIEKNNYKTDIINDSTNTIILSENDLKTYHLNLKKYILMKDTLSALYPAFKQAGYSPDNFGPIKVPEKSFFVLGDNRHEAADSRYIGFVKENDVFATVIN
ncbi:hypothetical protein GCM10023149_10000 [Mucilaginibacter gynuensis]|uniref:Signal peptidase I n=2 Tax=Mucilaginibacter gynuensis TaxID=1302236 RepID=A0ABP8FZ69_9SPHI